MRCGSHISGSPTHLSLWHQCQVSVVWNFDPSKSEEVAECFVGLIRLAKKKGVKHLQKGRKKDKEGEKGWISGKTSVFATSSLTENILAGSCFFF
jgi:hypothetical protein